MTAIIIGLERSNRAYFNFAGNACVVFPCDVMGTTNMLMLRYTRSDSGVANLAAEISRR